MSITRRIYFSVPTTAWHNDHEVGLTDVQLYLIQGLAKRINEIGYTVEVFARFGITDSPTSTAGWTFEEAEQVLLRCAGAVFIGLPRWILDIDADQWRLATEFSYYEAGVAVTLGLPRLVLREEGLLPRVIFDTAYKEYIATFPTDADSGWLESPKFQHAFAGWKHRLAERRDVFLGYSSKSAGPANSIKLCLENMGVTVLDWKTEETAFMPGSNLLEQIQEAAGRCTGAIFLFTKDDQLAGKGEKAAPRDNVVFEAGYFTAAKGKQRVLIIREEGSKMPADLGGDIYLELHDRADITPIQNGIRKFVEQRL